MPQAIWKNAWRVDPRYDYPSTGNFGKVDCRGYVCVRDWTVQLRLAPEQTESLSSVGMVRKRSNRF